MKNTPRSETSDFTATEWHVPNRSYDIPHLVERRINAVVGAFVAAVLGILANPVFGQTPANDQFASPQVITGVSGNATGTNVNATLEEGEPTTTAGFPANKSVWLQWVAPATGSFFFSLTADFDSQLAIYTGTTIDALTPLNEADPPGIGGDSLTLQTSAGTGYLIRVTGYFGQTGSFTMDWSSKPVYETIHKFTVASMEEMPAHQPGLFPSSKLVYGSDGNFYGTTSEGGIGGHGTVFRLSASAVLVTLVEFTGTTGSRLGSLPSGLIQGGDGNFYGTTGTGGTANMGTVYKMTPKGILTTLLQFDGISGANKGSSPSANLVQGTDGNFYGTTRGGGANDLGTIFKLSPTGTLTTIVEFTGTVGSHNGARPGAGLLLANDGDFYGTTTEGGSHNFGTIFRMTPGGNLTTLVEFTGTVGGAKGARPNCKLLEGSDGNFYGTTSNGGLDMGPYIPTGTVFKITPGGTLTTLVEFSGGPTFPRGGVPVGGLVEGNDGFLYGTTRYGSSFYESPVGFGGNISFGTIFKITPSGTFTSILEFENTLNGKRGKYPTGELTKGSDGNFYGSTTDYGVDGFGTVFKMTPDGVLTTLTEFDPYTGNSNGNGTVPKAGLLQSRDGNLYGTTSAGGGSGNGTVFKITPDETLTTLASFTGLAGNRKGSDPQSSLIEGSDGNFYGNTYSGGTPVDFPGPSGGAGTVFKMTPGGVLTILSDGGVPQAPLVEGSNGILYGVKSMGGNSVYKITPDGQFSSLAYINDAGHSSPFGSIATGADGNFYGTTTFVGGDGTIFRLTPDGLLTTLVQFTGVSGSAMGSHPRAALLQGGDGFFYGTTLEGGNHGDGTIFTMTPGGALTHLASFDNSGGNFTSTPDWNNIPIGSRTSIFSISFRLTPHAFLMDGIVGLSQGVSDWYDDMPCTLRLNPEGRFDAIDGSNFYQAKNAMYYSPLQTYNVVMTVDFASATYTVTVDGTLIAENYAFRAGTSGIGSLDTLVIKRETYSHAVAEVSLLKQGRAPKASLVFGPDGYLYGTTSSGGANEKGTIYKIKPGGAPITLRHFEENEMDGSSQAALVLGNDGNLYGTSTGNSEFSDYGSVYCLVFPGSPNISQQDPVDLKATEVTLRCTIRPRSTSFTTINLEYGSDGLTFPNVIPILPRMIGFQSIPVGRTLTNLIPGSTYYYRFVATNSAGSIASSVQSFSTLAPPIAGILPASATLPNSSTMRGAVNARNFATSVRFEWGTDGNSFPNTLLSTTPSVEGNTSIAVSAPVAGLAEGSTYYYRIVASSVGGTTVSGVQSFTTLTDPTAIIGGSFALSTTSVRVEGTANARGSETTVAFEYGTDGVTFNSVPAVPSTITGESNTPVSAVLTNLSQGVTYHYRIRVSSLGGTDTSTTATFTMNVLSGFARNFPNFPPGFQGFIIVNLTPSGVGGWRFVGEQAWRASGIPVGGLTTSDRVIEFMPVDNYIQPPPEPVTITSGGAATFVNLPYYSIGQGTGSGGLSVILKPDSLADSNLPEAERSQWRLFKLGTNNDPWRNSGETLTGLVPGSYLVECKQVEGRTTPPPGTVRVDDGDPSLITITYFLEDSQAGAAPVVLPFETVSTSTQLPYAHVGQIRSDAGSSSGFVVKPRVVVTAGHVVFDDGTLSMVTGLQWLFQRDAGTYEPVPQIPRGIYLLDDYAAARAAPGAVPGVGTLESQNRDAATLFFKQDAGRGGFGGFLASDATNNEFLLSPAQKMLVGYPVDGDGFIPGRMHATAAINVGFARVPTQDQFGNPFKTYNTTDIRGSGGMSGGPLCVQFENGPYYPAAIYLGGFNQTVVRAIDSKVIDLITSAEAASVADDNNTGGGITLSSFSTLAGGSTQSGALKVIIMPEEARNAGAKWHINSGPPRDSEDQETLQSSGSPYTLTLDTVTGFAVPAPQNVTIKAGKVHEITFKYAVLNTKPSLGNLANAVINEDGTTGAIPFTVSDPNSQAGSLTMTGSSSNTGLVPNSNITFGGSGGNRTVTVTPAPNQSGTATITLTVSDGTQEDTTLFTVTVNGVNDAPTIGNVNNKTIDEDNSTEAIDVTLNDVDHGENSLLLTGMSSNTSLVPNSNIAIAGNGANRTVTVTPAANQNGTATITLTVSDGDLTDTDTFVLTVQPVEDAPTISNVTNKTIAAGSSTGVIPFTIENVDADHGENSLEMSGFSSNPALVPNANIVFGGNGANRTVTVTPSADQLGSAIIALTVSDGNLTDTDTFTLTVTGTAQQTWRFTHFGTTSNTGSAANSADPDGDGQKNIDEYAAGTNPNNASDVFKILTSQKSGGTFTVSAAGKSGRTYALQRCSNLSTGTWNQVTAQGPLTANGTVTLTDPAAPALKSFYRIAVSVP